MIPGCDYLGFSSEESQWSADKSVLDRHLESGYREWVILGRNKKRNQESKTGGLLV